MWPTTWWSFNLTLIDWFDASDFDRVFIVDQDVPTLATLLSSDRLIDDNLWPLLWIIGLESEWFMCFTKFMSELIRIIERDPLGTRPKSSYIDWGNGAPQWALRSAAARWQRRSGTRRGIFGASSGKRNPERKKRKKERKKKKRKRKKRRFSRLEIAVSVRGNGEDLRRRNDV